MSQTRGPDVPEQFLQQFGSQSSAFAWLIDPDSETVRFLSDGYSAIWGDVGPSNPDDLAEFVAAVHPDDRAMVRDEFTTATALDVTCRLDAIDSTYVRIVGQPIYDEDETLVGLGGHAEEVTETVERRRELETHRDIVENLTDVATIIDTEGTVTYVSPSVQNLLGYEPTDLLGENGFEYHHPDDREMVARAIDRLQAAPDTEQTVELRFRHADGSWRWIEVTLQYPETNEFIDGILASSRDISERKQREAELEHSNESTRRSSRTSKMRSFSSTSVTMVRSPTGGSTTEKRPSQGEQRKLSVGRHPSKYSTKRWGNDWSRTIGSVSSDRSQCPTRRNSSSRVRRRPGEPS
jgi:PAS domain S-box-containing protein